jgi:hypothetical protein
MKTQHKTAEKYQPAREHDHVLPEATKWNKAVPPRIAAKNSAQTGEWRPGESAHRGYEKAVEDWWWL